jgi:hypothetical protein
MLQFIKEIPDVITRLIDRIDSPAIQDTILRIIACEEAGVTGTIEVSCQNCTHWLQIVDQPMLFSGYARRT